MKIEWRLREPQPRNFIEPAPQEVRLLERYYGDWPITLGEEQIPVLRGMHHAFVQFIDRSRLFADLCDIISKNGTIVLCPWG